MSPLPLALIAALVLGLRHATDPDHLTAVSILALDERSAAKRTALLGAAWGLGHALTLVLLGLPLVFVGWLLPETVQRGAEALVGVIIAVLAVRLLVRWWRGYFHLHPHTHDGASHVHPHFHESEPAHEAHALGHQHEHGHEHAHAHVRSPGMAFGVGLVHGIGGSAGASLLLLAGRPAPAEAAACLLVFALGTALAMTLVSACVGYAVSTRPARLVLERMVPVLGCGSLAFGLFYLYSALAS